MWLIIGTQYVGSIAHAKLWQWVNYAYWVEYAVGDMAHGLNCTYLWLTQPFMVIRLA